MIYIYISMHIDPLQRNMNNAAKTEAAREKAVEPRKPQNPEALRAQEQKVTHDKVVDICNVAISNSSPSDSEFLESTCRNESVRSLTRDLNRRNADKVTFQSALPSVTFEL